MGFNHFLGILVILAGYSFTWYLLFKSKKILQTIDKEGLEHIREIKSRIKGRDLGDEK